MVGAGAAEYLVPNALLVQGGGAVYDDVNTVAYRPAAVESDPGYHMPTPQSNPGYEMPTARPESDAGYHMPDNFQAGEPIYNTSGVGDEGEDDVDPDRHAAVAPLFAGEGALPSTSPGAGQGGKGRIRRDADNRKPSVYIGFAATNEEC